MIPSIVPTTLDAVLDPDWLHGALDDIDETDRIISVEEVDGSKTLAQKIRFRVVVEAADGTQRERAYCVKAHLDGSPGGDLFSEALFYGELASRLDVRMPRAYYTALDSEAGQAMVIMDDVVANGGTFQSARTPYTLETTRDTLGQLARLHAATWGGARVDDLPWLAPRVAAMGANFPPEMLQSLLDDGRGPDIAPELRDADKLIQAVRRAGQFETTCVLHGDTHSGNTYVDARGDACWLDWQVVQLGNWATDISYHLATVLDIDDRRAHEADLLRHYLAELSALGAPAPSFIDAWELYTLGFTYGYLLWVITRISSREIVLIHIPRLAAALTDHDTFRRLGVT